MLKKFHSPPFPKYIRTLAAFLTCACITGLCNADTYDIDVRYERGDYQMVTAKFEHKGVVIVDQAGQKDDAERLPLDVSAKLEYSERFTGDKNDMQSIRLYKLTDAEIKISDGETTPKLNPQNNLIVARIQDSTSQRLQLASVNSVLKQSELELIRNPCDPLSFAALFNKQNVEQGEKWNVDSVVIADFLAVDRVYENDVTLILKSVTNNIAKVYVVGSVRAEVDDVTTELEVSCICLIDLDKQVVRSVRSTLREDRSPGQIAPGFQGQTKIDMKCQTVDSVSGLTNTALARTRSKKIERRLKWEPQQGEFHVTYDPRWRVIASESEAAVLRYLDRGDLLAQCNIVQLEARPANNPLKLPEFRAEVEKIVKADKKAEVVKAQELKTSNNLRALRVVVEGVESEVPITWIYYHVAEDDGRRVTYVFTLERNAIDRFGIADKLLVNETFFKSATETASRPVSGSTLQPRR